MARTSIIIQAPPYIIISTCAPLYIYIYIHARPYNDIDVARQYIDVARQYIDVRATLYIDAPIYNYTIYPYNVYINVFIYKYVCVYIYIYIYIYMSLYIDTYVIVVGLLTALRAAHRLRLRSMDIWARCISPGRSGWVVVSSAERCEETYYYYYYY